MRQTGETQACQVRIAQQHYCASCCDDLKIGSCSAECLHWPWQPISFILQSLFVLNFLPRFVDNEHRIRVEEAVLAAALPDRLRLVRGTTPNMCNILCQAKLLYMLAGCSLTHCTPTHNCCCRCCISCRLLGAVQC
jgi:hypothetical protein